MSRFRNVLERYPVPGNGPSGGLRLNRLVGIFKAVGGTKHLCFGQYGSSHTIAKKALQTAFGKIDKHYKYL